MSEHLSGGLVRGTLADLRTLMSHPVGLRRGHTAVVKSITPAAGAGFTYAPGASWWERIVTLTFTLTTSAVAGIRFAVLNYLDADGALINQVPLTPAVGAGEAWIVSADLQGTVFGGSGASSDATGTFTSPGIGATITSVTVPAGQYTVNWLVGLSGTIAAPADVNNFALFVGAVQVAVSANEAIAGNFAQEPVTIEVPSGGAVLAVKAIGAGTAASVYDASLAAQFAIGLASYPELPDLVLKSGWSVAVVVAGELGGDQISSVVIVTERYPSNWADGSLGSDLEQLLELAEG